MKNILVFILLSLLVGYGFYLVGWYRGVSYEAVASAIVHGEIDVLTARAIRSQRSPEALTWIETDIKNMQAELGGLSRNVPCRFSVSYARVLRDIEKYRKSY